MINNMALQYIPYVCNVCVLLFFIKSILLSHYRPRVSSLVGGRASTMCVASFCSTSTVESLWSRGFLKSESRVTHSQLQIADVPTRSASSFRGPGVAESPFFTLTTSLAAPAKQCWAIQRVQCLGVPRIHAYWL